MSITRYAALLECLHTVVYPGGRPTAGDFVLCRKCNRYRLVTAYTVYPAVSKPGENPDQLQLDLIKIRDGAC